MALSCSSESLLWRAELTHGHTTKDTLMKNLEKSQQSLQPCKRQYLAGIYSTLFAIVACAFFWACLRQFEHGEYADGLVAALIACACFATHRESRRRIRQKV